MTVKSPYHAQPIPVGVIVTLAGTGSECNGAAVITNEAKKIKTGYDYPACNPRFALMDPSYTFSEPDEQNVSDEIAEALMRSVIRNTRLALDDPENYMARSNLFWD